MDPHILCLQDCCDGETRQTIDAILIHDGSCTYVLTSAATVTVYAMVHEYKQGWDLLTCMWLVEVSSICWDVTVVMTFMLQRNSHVLAWIA